MTIIETPQVEEIRCDNRHAWIVAGWRIHLLPTAEGDFELYIRVRGEEYHQDYYETFGEALEAGNKWAEIAVECETEIED